MKPIVRLLSLTAVPLTLAAPAAAQLRPVCYVHAVADQVVRANPDPTRNRYCKIIHYETGYSYTNKGRGPTNSFGYVDPGMASVCVARAEAWVKHTSTANSGGCMRAIFNGKVVVNIGPVP